MQLVQIETSSKTPPNQLVMAFRGDYNFLSNFHPCVITLEEQGQIWHYQSTENAYMAWKTEVADYRNRLQNLTPREAKALSRTDEFRAAHRPEYSDHARIQAMLDFNHQKYSPQNPELMKKLMATEAMTLVEGTTWNDTFFGFCLNTGTGHNYLGRILMTIRDELRIKAGLTPIHEQKLLPKAIK